MNEKIEIIIKPYGNGKKRVSIKTDHRIWYFHFDKENCERMSRVFEEAADDLMSWDGTTDV